MSATRVRSCFAQIWQGTTFTILGRLLADDGEVSVQADYSGMRYAVFEDDGTEEGVEVIPSTPLVVADVVFDTLQTDARWTNAVGDETGYNFRFTLGPSACPEANKTYKVPVWATLDGSTEHVVHVWTVKTEKVLGS